MGRACLAPKRAVCLGTADLAPEPVRSVMTAGDNAPDLSAFQLEAARLFFALPASRGFLLAGGAALLAQHLTARPTEDLDFFTSPERGQVQVARDALEAAARQRGWSAQRIHGSDTFCRMVIHGAAAGVLVDLAVNAPPDLPASSSPAPDRRGLRLQCARPHDLHTRPVHGRRDPCARRVVRGRPASVLRDLAIRTNSVSRIS